jgi:hypothetical protein
MEKCGNVIKAIKDEKRNEGGYKDNELPLNLA